MALWKKWEALLATHPSALSDAVDFGIQQLGYDRIKPKQLAAVSSILMGKDVFLSVPTGYGKSLVYQILPFCARHLLQLGPPGTTTLPARLSPTVIVVSPLVSLMDQVAKLTRMSGIRAVCVGSAATSSSASEAMDDGVTHVFGSPEALVGSKHWRPLFLGEFSQKIVAVAIDEAHCIAKWCVYIIITLLWRLTKSSSCDILPLICSSTGVCTKSFVSGMPSSHSYALYCHLVLLL